MDQTSAHTALKNEVLLAIGADPRCRVWSNNTGVGMAFSGHVTRFGLKGSADILGILRGGTLLAIEIKTGKARQSKEQIAFQKMIGEFGGHYLVCRSPSDATSWLDRISPR